MGRKPEIGSQIIKIFSRINSIFFLFISFIFKDAIPQEINTEIRRFIANLSIVGIGTLCSTGIIFAINIYAGRVLGPVEYGTFNLVVSISMMLCIPMMMGLASTEMKLLSVTMGSDQHRKIIFNIFLLFIIFTLTTIFFYNIFLEDIARTFSTSTDIVKIAILFGIVYVTYTLMQRCLLGLHKMNLYSYSIILYALITGSVFIVAISISKTSGSMIVSYFISYLVTSLVILYLLRDHFHLALDIPVIKEIGSYNILYAFGGLSYMVYTNIDKILINKFLTPYDLGVYSVYQFSSVNIMVLFSSIFTMVFFPTINKYSNKNFIFKMLVKGCLIYAIAGLPFIMLIQFLILLVFGDKYPISIGSIALFSTAAILISLYEILVWFFNSEKKWGIRKTITTTTTIAIVNTTFCLILIPQYGLYGAVMSIIISFLIGVSILFIYGYRAYFRGDGIGA